MTKKEVERIIKRYKYIKRAIKENEGIYYFYIGHRKQKLVITDEVKMVYEIIEDIRKNVKDEWLKRMVNGILRGNTDIFMIQVLPCEKTFYYKWKEKFIQTIYRCCAAKQIIGYKELLKEGIA